MLDLPAQYYLDGNLAPDPFEVFASGAGDGNFIASCAHHPNLRQTNMFEITGGAPSRDAANCIKFAGDNRLPFDMVSPNLQYLLMKERRRLQLGERKKMPGLSVTTPTPIHGGQIVEALDLDVHRFKIDKPHVVSIAEHKAVKEALERAKKRNPSLKYRLHITFNHRFFAAVFQLKALIKAKKLEGVEVKLLFTWFLQKWLMTDPGIRQSDWRLAAWLCGLLDIGTHELDLGSFIGDSRIKLVRKSNLGTAGTHGRQVDGKDVIDNGDHEYVLDNGIQCRGRFHQALEGHDDDIGAMVEFDDGEIYMFKLEWGTCSLFKANCTDPNPDDASNWDRHFAGSATNNIFDMDAVAGVLKNPAGHIQGWDLGWLFMFMGIAGQYLRDDKHPCAEHLPACMNLPLATFERAGLQTVRAVEACVQSFEGGGKEVELNDKLGV